MGQKPAGGISRIIQAQRAKHKEMRTSIENTKGYDKNPSHPIGRLPSERRTTIRYGGLPYCEAHSRKSTVAGTSASDATASTLNSRRFTLALYRWRNPRVPLRGDRYATSGESGAEKDCGGFGGFGIVDKGFHELGVVIGWDGDVFSGGGGEELAGFVVQGGGGFD